jgi:4-azaleucine resistance transporter AzlC
MALLEVGRSSRSDFRSGFLACVPLWLGAAPFGMIYAVTAISAGLDSWQTLAMSLFVFAGASQFTAAGLFAAGAAPFTILLTTLIINARHLLLAASLAPYLRGLSSLRRVLLGAQLTDETYALGLQRYLSGAGSPAFFFGANVGLYLCWQLSTIAGIALGSTINDPAAYGLDLVFPLTFIGLLVPLLRERINQFVALVAALLALAGALLLPGQWYLLLAGIGASFVGYLLQKSGFRIQDSEEESGRPNDRQST